jgi:hypothetical protein
MVGLQFTPIMVNLGSLLNGIVNYNSYVPGMKLPGIDDFFKRYEERAVAAKVDPLGYYLPPFNYAIGQMLEQAVNATKSIDDKVLADYLRKNEMQTVVGPIRFDANGERANQRRDHAQFRGIKDKDTDQFRQPGKQVIIHPTRQQRQGDRALRRGPQGLGGDSLEAGAEAAPASPEQAARGRARACARRAGCARAAPFADFTRGSAHGVLLDLLFEAVLFGVLLGCFYAAVSLGLSVVVRAARHPPRRASRRSWCWARTARTCSGTGHRSDPRRSCCSRRRSSCSASCSTASITKPSSDARFRGRGARAGVLLRLRLHHRGGADPGFGVDQRGVQASYIGSSLELGEFRIPVPDARRRSGWRCC